MVIYHDIFIALAPDLEGWEKLDAKSFPLKVL
jgi:hypothetical protein